MVGDVLFKKFTASMNTILKTPLLNDKVVVALSGGVDSIVLLDLLLRYKREYTKLLEVHAITVDHGLRKESSWEAKEVGKSLDKKRVVHSVLRISQKIDRGRMEEHARELRYTLMGNYYREIGAGAIFMGHHKNDQSETFLMRLLAGSTLWGLCGMQSVSNGFMGMKICRPLLDMSKGEIYEYARERRLRWFEDASNRDTDLTVRNWLRELLACNAHLSETVENLHGEVINVIYGMVRKRMKSGSWEASAELDPVLMRMALRIPIGGPNDIVGTMAVDRWIYEQLWRISPSRNYLHRFTRFDGKNCVVVMAKRGTSLWEDMTTSGRGKKTLCGCVVQWEKSGRGDEMVVDAWRESPHHGKDVKLEMSRMIKGDRVLYDERVYVEPTGGDLAGLEMRLLYRGNMELLWVGPDLLQDLILLLGILGISRAYLWESNLPVIVVQATGEIVGIPTMELGKVAVRVSPKRQITGNIGLLV